VVAPTCWLDKEVTPSNSLRYLWFFLRSVPNVLVCVHLGPHVRLSLVEH
jgi:hypothetical protein